MSEPVATGAAAEKAPLALRGLLFDLAALDRLDVEALVLLPCKEDRPLRGAAGWCDWRLCGRLSRLIEEGWYQPRRHELLLLDGAGRLGSPRVLVLGQGSRAALDATAVRRSGQRLAEVLRGAGWRSFACEVPGTEPGPLPAPEAIGAFLAPLAEGLSGRELTMLCPHRRFREYLDKVARDIAGVKLVP